MKTPKVANIQSTTVTETCTVTVSFLSTPSYGIPAAVDKREDRIQYVPTGWAIGYKDENALTWPYTLIAFIVAVSKLKVFVHSGYFMLYKMTCKSHT